MAIPLWFYASQLFDDYHVRDVGGSSEVTRGISRQFA